ncbi:rhomboid family intramembrane serine protease [Spiractinospora alimapuensis]|uniref:rhomboid family intramembrane serine protease n=1 Tax=Spiractinospora alimapuensis TaxID=2820884 RepID=UPI001F3775C9|nr:rhomboid family intramembrane serine protease [Spiractinospora alimapuensis]
MASSRLRAVLLVLLLAAVMWVVHLVNWLSGSALTMRHGIYPRATDGLTGILTAPFLHGDFAHLMANSVPLLVLGALVAFSGLGRFLGASLIIILVSGAGVWLLGPTAVPTVGASGLVFGYFGYLVLRGLVERKPLDLAIMVGVVILYGTLIFGVLPGDEGISWQAHLFGFIGGLGAAWALPKRTPAVQPSPGYGSYGRY